MRNEPLKGFLKKSPMKAGEYDFKKTADYSSKATKGKLGDKIAKAVTPTSFAEMVPVGKVLKLVKGVYKYVTG